MKDRTAQHLTLALLGVALLAIGHCWGRETALCGDYTGPRGGWSGGYDCREETPRNLSDPQSPYVLRDAP